MRSKTISAFGLGVFSALAVFVFTAAIAQQIGGKQLLVHTHHDIPLTIQIPSSVLEKSLTITFTVGIDHEIILAETHSVTSSTKVDITGLSKELNGVAGDVSSQDIITPVISIPLVPTPNPNKRLGTVRQNANLRAGPSTSSTIIGQVSAGKVVEIVGDSGDGSWLHLSDGNWIASSLIDAHGNIQAPRVEPTPYPRTATESIYLEDAKRILGPYARQLRDLKNTMRLVEQDRSMLGKKAWLTEIAADVLLMRVDNNNLRKLIPSARLADIHAKLTDALDSFDQAIDIVLRDPTNPMTVDMYNEATAHFNVGYQKLVEYLELLRDFEKDAPEK